MHVCAFPTHRSPPGGFQINHGMEIVEWCILNKLGSGQNAYLPLAKQTPPNLPKVEDTSFFMSTAYQLFNRDKNPIWLKLTNAPSARAIPAEANQEE